MYGEDKKIQQTGFWGEGVGGFLKGVILAFCLTLVLLTVSSLVVTYTNVSENAIFALSLTCAVISMGAGSISAAKTAARRGYLKGALCGGTYVLVLYIIASLINGGFIFTSHTLMLFAIGVIVGALGGIIGINTGGRRKR